MNTIIYGFFDGGSTRPFLPHITCMSTSTGKGLGTRLLYGWSGNQTTMLGTTMLRSNVLLLIQSYLKSVNDLWEEFVGHKVVVFAVCGQPKEEVDLMMSKNNLKFKVGT